MSVAKKPRPPSKPKPKSAKPKGTDPTAAQATAAKAKAAEEKKGKTAADRAAEPTSPSEELRAGKARRTSRPRHSRSIQSKTKSVRPLRG